MGQSQKKKKKKKKQLARDNRGETELIRRLLRPAPRRKKSLRTFSNNFKCRHTREKSINSLTFFLAHSFFSSEEKGKKE
jgi:hypothetical protein